MNNSSSSRHENTQDDLGHYLHERPGLLLKMLDIAERCCRESEVSVPRVSQDRAA